MGPDPKNKITKILTGVMSGYIFLLLSSPVFAGTQDSPTVMGKGLISELSNLFKIFGITFAIITIMVIGIKLAISKNSEEAARTGEWLKYVIIGLVIITMLTTIVGFIVNLEGKFHNAFELPKTSTPPGEKPGNEAQDENSSNLFINAITAIVNSITSFIVWIGKVADFKPIDKLLFESGSVFTADQYKFMLSFYWLVAIIATAFIVVMISKTAVQLMAFGYSARRRADLMEEIYTWFEVIIVIAAYPIIFVYLIKFFDLLTNWLYRYVQLEYTYMGNNNFANSDTDAFISQVHTQNLLNTAIVKLLYTYNYFKINLIFLVRKIVLGVFFLFAPIAAAMWGIKKDANVMNVWFGEIITNASMGFFYAFALLAIIHLVNALNNTGGWFFTLIAMWMLPQLGGTLRNMLQNWFQRMSGINEENAVNPLFTGIFPMVRGSTKSLAHTISSRTGTKSEATSEPTTTSAGITTDKSSGDKSSGSGFGGIPAGGGLAGASSAPEGGKSKFSPEVASATNKFSDTENTRKAFLQAFGTLAGSNLLYKMGSALQDIGNSTYADNPMFGMFTNLAGSALKTAGSGFKIGKAIDYATLHKMANSEKYRQEMAKIVPVSNFLTQEGKGHLLTEAIKTGNAVNLVKFLNEKESPVPVDFVDTIGKLHKAYKEERKIVEKQLGINVVHASLKMGKSTESFENYFYKKHPYKNASEAFIFKV